MGQFFAFATAFAVGGNNHVA
ncbi:membrane protein YoeI [Cronobacter sakazakii]|uniref:Membrane protein YoeI n=1 Tax=Cronobacter sakazakii TaxID=28141 RepID=A0A2S9UAV6_CROSK|nr:membrane protein YoeI [Cronobacter sakazakii]AZP35548.1 membrane protein YoeI [Cronobacter sakazakii]EGT0043227.1 membrane protein YoeI [Cronobacter sakazakii]EGT4237963.1 membrane protein YoeI [Cronobacter sakazakii]EGT4258107.1 membrane protein YoeI [Cronobacter sakazakii]